METRAKRRAPTSDKVQPKTTATPSKRAKVANTTSTTTTPTKKNTLAKGTKAKSSTDSKPAKDTTSNEKQQPLSATGLTNEDGTRISVWLMKSEPDTFSIDDLINSKGSTSHWDGVRNHEAKNLMKNSMKVGDQVLFYHSNTKAPGIVAMAKIAREAYPDHTAFDPKSDYYDSKSSKDDPRWFMVDVKYERKLKRVLTLKELQQYKDKELGQMKLLNRGRLSVQPVSDSEMKFIMDLEQQDEPNDG
ncbi:MAG: thymocyte nuclear protein 1-like protein [Linnemannia elongata]|nr:MAG: thymocyte nuclear protein 1-like protein [Linnemannia elongata]